MSYNNDIISMLRGTVTRRNTVECTTANYDDVDWPTISLQPLFYGEDKTAFSSHKAIFNEDDQRVITVATDAYSLIDHKELLEQAAVAMEDAGFSDLSCEVTLVNHGDKMLARFTDTNHPLTINHNEEIYPTFVIKNSYDLGWAATVVGGVFRQVCSNGAYVGHANGFQRRHVGSNTSSRMDTILKNVAQEVQYVEKKFNNMIDESVKRGVHLNINALKLTDAEKTKLLEMQELSSQAKLKMHVEDDTEIWELTDAGHNAFDVYNLLTEFTSHKILNPVRQDTLSVAVNNVFLRHSAVLA